MLVHDFIAIPRGEIPKEITYNLTNLFPSVQLSDDIILNNVDFFSSFSTYWDDFSSSIRQGLNYHGITIITNESLPEFICVLKKYKLNKEVQKLLEFCITSLSSQKDIIHFGI